MVPSPPEHELDAPPWQRFEATLMATSRSIRALYNDALNEVELSLTEALVVAHVEHRASMSQTQVADEMGITRAAVGGIVEMLLERGILSRDGDPTDRRRKLLSITSSGAEVARRIAEIDVELRTTLRRGVPKTDRTQLAATLLRVQQNISAAERRL